MPLTAVRTCLAAAAARARRSAWIQSAAIVLSGVLAMGNALRGGWIWDDDREITGNGLLRSTGGLGKIWFAPPGPDYLPLHSTVQWLEWRLWRDNPAGYHAVGLALHLAGALLLWRLLRKLGAPWAWFGGLLFAVHPLAVESAAWASELKNTLSLPLALAAAILYLDYDETRRRRYWALAIGAFLAAMLAKSSVVMLPVVLLLHAWWKRGRIAARDVAVAAPFFAVSLALGLVTMSFQRNVAIGGWIIAMGGPAVRVARAGRVIGFYLLKSVFPVGLSPMYPRWPAAPPTLAQALPFLALCGLAGWCWARRSGWGRHALLGLSFFAVNLVPVLGFIPMSYLRYSWVADHFAYISLVGAAGLMAAGAGALHRRFGGPWVAIASGVVAALFVAQSRRYTRVFHDSERLWARALELDPGSWAARYNLGTALVRSGRVGEGIGQFQEAIRLRRDFPEAYNNLGYAWLGEGRPAEAEAMLRQALRLDPDYADAHINLGNALARGGRVDEAIGEYRQAVRLEPGSPDAEVNLANALERAGRREEAEADYRKALQLNAAFAPAHFNLGILLVRAGRRDQAAGEIQAALKDEPGNFRAWNELGAILAEQGQLSRAESCFGQALRLKPDYAGAESNLANALFQERRPAEAIFHYEAALRLDPGLAEARRNLEEARRALDPR